MVSVIIPVFNREKEIEKSVKSVMNQTYKDIEIIVVDDCSNDRTKEIIERLSKLDNRIKLICHSMNKGACAARNTGIDNANGDFIAFHDSDDIWFPEKLHKQMLVMKKSGCDVCFCQYEIDKGDCNSVGPTCFKAGMQENMRYFIGISTQTLLFRKSVLDEYRFDDRFPRMQDVELMLRVSKDKSIFFLKEPLVSRFFSENSISINPEYLYQACDLFL